MIAALPIAQKHARSGLPIQQFTDLVHILIEAHGPAGAAFACARLSSMLRRAAASTDLAGIVTPRLSLKTSQLNAAADLMVEMAVCCWAIPEKPEAAHA